MDTVTGFAQWRQESGELATTIAAPDTSRVAVTAMYSLSGEGRKASLLTGGDGKAVQQLALPVPANRLHLERRRERRCTPQASSAVYRPYARDGIVLLQTHLRQHAAYADAAIDGSDLLVTSANAVTATQAQWALVQHLQTTFSDATVTLRTHRLAWKGHPQAPSMTVFSVVVARKCGPFTLRRDFAAPDT